MDRSTPIYEEVRALMRNDGFNVDAPLVMDAIVQTLAHRDKRITELERYKSAFFRVGAEIAKASCCGPADTEGCSLGQLHNCTRERLMVVFLNERRALGNE